MGQRVGLGRGIARRRRAECHGGSRSNGRDPVLHGRDELREPAPGDGGLRGHGDVGRRRPGADYVMPDHRYADLRCRGHQAGRDGDGHTLGGTTTSTVTDDDAVPTVTPMLNTESGIDFGDVPINAFRPDNAA